MLRELVCKTEKDTAKLACEFAKTAKKGDVFALYGTLGMGKSVFARAFIQALCDVDDVPSPTFTLLQTYSSPKGDIYHFDLYRLEHTGISTITEELREYSEGKKITFVEWAEFSQGELPFERIEINVTYDDDDSRNYEFKSIGEKNNYVIEGLKQ